MIVQVVESALTCRVGRESYVCRSVWVVSFTDDCHHSDRNHWYHADFEVVPGMLVDFQHDPKNTRCPCCNLFIGGELKELCSNETT